MLGAPGALARSLGRYLQRGWPLPQERASGKRLFSVSDPGAVDVGLERRIVELGDGRQVDEALAILYREELRAGAWMADIGVWKTLFLDGVMKVIGDLAAQGHVVLEDSPRDANADRSGLEKQAPKIGTER